MRVGETKKMLSRDCDGCSQQKACSIRYRKVTKGGKVYCPDGTAHLVDEYVTIQGISVIELCQTA